MSSSPARFVAVDLRQQSAMVGAVDADRRVVLKPRALAPGELEPWLRRSLEPSDAVVIAAPADGWQIHDRIAPLVASVTIAHPQLSSLLPVSAAPGDPRDTIKLARLHAAGLVPALWVPPPYVRDMRALAAHRRRLLAQRAAARDTLHDLLRRHALRPPGADRLAADRRDWWEAAGLPADDLARARASFVALNRAEPLLAGVEERLRRRGAEAPWQPALAALMRTPGMTELNAVVLLSAIGDVERFPTADQLAAYAGLAGREPGEDTREPNDGRREIRSTMLEVAWEAIATDTRWRARFEQLEARIGRSRAIVATARKLLLVVWERLAEQRAQPAEEAKARRAA